MPSSPTPLRIPTRLRLPWGSRFSLTLVAGLLWLLTLPVGWANEAERREQGETIYRDQCGGCHGDDGRGTEDFYPDALVGDSSVGELAEIITDTMPEEDPEACVGEDAEAVAAYIHHAFYSEAARVRNRPPQLSLSRLTASQLRQSLADLYSRFDGGTLAADSESGIQGQYFEGRRWKEENRKIRRVDPVLDFDFGHQGPGGEIGPEEFYIHWSGGLKVDATGHYEIVARSTCSFVMKFGAGERVLINNHVQSGDKTEFRRKLHLTAGRIYPIHIDFTQRKRKTEQPPARFSLSWTPPGGMEEIIPARQLTKQVPPASFALQADLPPDDRSYGYERGISVSRQWDESTTVAAIEFASFAVEELWPRYQRRNRDEPDDDRQRLRNFLATLVETAFRAPLDDDLRRRYVDRPVDAEADDGEAIRRGLLMALKSPRFLYPMLDDSADPSRQVANRLALVLFDSLPTDRWLLELVEKDALRDRDAIRRAAQRMVDDYRTRGKVREAFVQWLGLSHFGEITKDQDRYPGFDEELVSDLRRSLDLTIEDVVWGDSSDFRRLFRDDQTYTTARLAEFYGEGWEPAEEEGPRLRRSVADPGRRFGVLNHPYLMSGLAYHAETSPIHRGVFLVRSLLGRTLRPPNEAFTPLSPDLHPDLTTRERVGLQTSPESCQVCHVKINSLGFTLENFDAVGRYRAEERDQKVDPSGSYRTRDDVEVEFSGPEDLADFLADSEDSHRAFVGRMFEFLVKQPIAAFGSDRLDSLTRSFREHDYSIRHLLVEIAVIAASQPLEAQPLEAQSLEAQSLEAQPLEKDS